MRKRLAQILEQAYEPEVNQEKNHEGNKSGAMARAGTFE